MNTEQLEAGRKLDQNIKELESHIVELEKNYENCKKGLVPVPGYTSKCQYISDGLKFLYRRGGTQDGIHLQSEFYSIEEFMLLYLMKAKKKLEEMKQQFDNL